MADPDTGGRAEATPARPPGGTSAFFQRYSLVAIAVALTVLCIATIPQFRSLTFFATTASSQSIIVLLALTATVVLRTGGFDISIAANMVACAAIVAVISAAGVHPVLAALAALGFGAGVACLNGFLVVKIGVDSFVVTLGSSTAIAGFTLFITDSRLVLGVPDAFVNFSRSTIAGTPLIVWYAAVLAVALWYVYERTPLGRYMLFVGGNESAARLAGIPVNSVRFGAFLASGTLAAFIGIVYTGYFAAVDPSVGSQYMLQPFAAAFLGSTAIKVGRFNAMGTLVALWVLVVGITGLQLLGAQSWVTNVFYGGALMIAVAAARLAGRTRLRAFSRRKGASSG